MKRGDGSMKLITFEREGDVGAGKSGLRAWKAMVPSDPMIFTKATTSVCGSGGAIRGTSEGVGIGSKPPKYAKEGDHRRLSITRLGVLENVIG